MFSFLTFSIQFISNFNISCSRCTLVMIFKIIKDITIKALEKVSHTTKWWYFLHDIYHKMFLLSISGVVAGAMARRHGFRFVMMLGAFIAALGFILSYWVRNIVLLFFTMGLMVGKWNDEQTSLFLHSQNFLCFF